MKWTRAVHHLETLAESCADMATRPTQIFPLRVVQLWAYGDVLGEPQDLEAVTVALAVNLPPDDVPWRCEPDGAQHWSNATRLRQSPVVPRWRSVHAPVWNHRIVRPALLWDMDTGVAEATLAALRDGRGEEVRAAAPVPEELAARLVDDLAVSLRALRERTARYADRRWAPGKLEPVADELWQAADGYLDLLAAHQAGRPTS